MTPGKMRGENMDKIQLFQNEVLGYGFDDGSYEVAMLGWIR